MRPPNHDETMVRRYPTETYFGSDADQDACFPFPEDALLQSGLQGSLLFVLQARRSRKVEKTTPPGLIFAENDRGLFFSCNPRFG